MCANRLWWSGKMTCLTKRVSLGRRLGRSAFLGAVSLSLFPSLRVDAFHPQYKIVQYQTNERTTENVPEAFRFSCLANNPRNIDPFLSFVSAKQACPRGLTCPKATLRTHLSTLVTYIQKPAPLWRSRRFPSVGCREGTRLGVVFDHGCRPVHLGAIRHRPLSLQQS